MNIDALLKLLGGGGNLMESGGGGPSPAPSPTPMNRKKMTRDEMLLSPPTAPEPEGPILSPSGGELGAASDYEFSGPKGFKDFMTSPLWGDKSMLLTKKEQGELWDSLNKPWWFLPNKGGHVPGTGDKVPTRIPASMSPPPGKEMWIPPEGDPTSENGGPESLFKRLDAERGGSAADRKMADGMTTATGGNVGDLSELARSAAEEIAKKAKTQKEAEDALRFEFRDDPYLESVLQEARERHAAAQGANREAPGIADYIGYALAMLGGANPMQAAELIGRRGQKRQDERLALQDLLNAQGAKVKDRGDQRRLYETGQRQMRQIETMLGRDATKATQRQTERAEDRTFQGGKAMRGAALQELQQLRMQYPTGTNVPLKDKKRMEELQKLINYAANDVLREPKPDDIGMGDPAVERILGLG